MRKIYSMFLAMALMVVGGVNVWAQDEVEPVFADLIHTGSSTKATGEIVNTVDAEMEHVNNTNINNNWGARAYVEFALDKLEDGMAITKAEFSFTAIGESRRERSASVYYVTNPDGTEENDYEDAFSWSAFDEQGVAIAPANTWIADCTFPQTPPTDNRRITIDVTDVLKAHQQAEADRVIFVVSNNPGGGDINGKNSAVAEENLPTLAIYMEDADTQTKYTIYFCDADGNDLKDPVQYDGTIDALVSASEADMASFVTTTLDEETGEEIPHKWVYESGNEEISLVEDADENNITLVFRPAAAYHYTLESSFGYTIAEGTGFEGETVTVPFSQYILKGKTLWQAQAIDKQFNYSFQLTEDNQVATIDYTETDINNVFYFTEAEDIDNEHAIASNGGNANIRCSNSYGAYFDEEVVLTTLPKGAYRLHYQVWGNTGVTFSFKAGETPITGPIYTYKEVDYDWGSTLGYIFGWNSDLFTVTEDTPIIINAAGANGKVIDWLYITKEADDITEEYIQSPAYLDENGNPDFSGWNFSEGRKTDKNYEAPMNLVRYDSNKNFDMYQNIDNLPSGHYKLTVHAFYRAGSLEDELRKVAEQKELEKNLVMVVKVLGEDAFREPERVARRLPAESKFYTQPIMNLTEDGDENGFYEETEGADRTSEVYTDDFVWVPNSAAAARLYYIAGHYVNEVEFDVFEDGPVMIGLVKDESIASDYCPIGSWNLFRLGDVEVEPETYNITVAPTENGMVEAQPEAEEGSTVSVLAVPNEGYKVDEAYIIYNVAEPTGAPQEVKEELEPTDETHGEFIMPSADVTIYITFKLDEGDEEEYYFIASEWVAGDPGRISPNDVSVNADENYIDVTAAGANNVNLNYQTQRNAYVDGAKYFVIEVSGISTEQGKSYLWWLNGTNRGSQVAPTYTIEGEDGFVTLVWDIEASGLGDTFTGERTYLDGNGAQHGGWTTCFGLTLADGSTAARFRNIDYVGENPATGINSVNNTAANKNGKYIENKAVVIVKNGKKYNVAGLEVK